MAVSWPLVGRAEELDFVVSALHDTSSGGVVIAGPPGVGKTRLARETVAALASDVAVEWAAATSASAEIPFAAVAHVLADVGSSDDRLALLKRATAGLIERAAGRPLVLAVDDAHWLDPGAAALVYHLVVSGAGRVLLTFRDGELPPDPIVALWKDGLVERLELQPLTPADVEDVVRAAIGGLVERSAIRRLFELTQGNALFLRELLLGALGSNEFELDEGVWRWSGDVHASTRLRAILDDRLRRLDRSAQAMLAYVALAEPLPLTMLEVLGGDDFLHFDDLESAGLVFVNDAQEVRLSHPLYGELLRTTMTTNNRRAMMRRLADTFEPAAGESRLTLLRVASWRLESGRSPRPSLLVDAANVALGAFDYELAERLARRALHDGAGLHAGLALAEALSRLGRGAEAAELLEPLAADACDDAERTEVAIARSFALSNAHGYRAEFASFLRDAERAVGDPEMAKLLRVQRALVLVYAGHLDEGLGLAAPAADARGDPLMRIRAFNALGVGWLSAGKVESVCELATELLGPALDLQDEFPMGPMWIMASYLPALIVSGRSDEADMAIDAIEAATPSSERSPDFATYLTFIRGSSALLRGEARTAQRSLKECVPGMRVIAEWRLPFPLALLVEASALAGDTDAAMAASEEAEALVERARVVEGMVRRARAWVAFARGQRTVAADLSRAAAAWSGAHGQHTAEIFALHDAIRFAGDRTAARALVERASVVEGTRANTLANHARAFLDDDGAGLEEAARRFEAIGAVLLAAEAAAHAADAFSRASLHGRGDRSRARAAVLAAACEDARSPVLEALGQPVSLTAREREVVQLAAQGMSSSAIAERLFVSTRTVEGHLHRSYTKLGVSDRRDLARLLGIHPSS